MNMYAFLPDALLIYDNEYVGDIMSLKISHQENYQPIYSKGSYNPIHFTHGGRSSSTLKCEVIIQCIEEGSCITIIDKIMKDRVGGEFVIASPEYYFNKPQLVQCSTNMMHKLPTKPIGTDPEEEIKLRSVLQSTMEFVYDHRANVKDAGLYNKIRDARETLEIEELKDLANHESDMIRQFVLGNENINEEVVSILLFDKNERIRRYAQEWMRKRSK